MLQADRRFDRRGDAFLGGRRDTGSGKGLHRGHPPPLTRTFPCRYPET